MKFQIENILTIKNKVYILTRMLDPAANFKLSESNLLGGLEIEHWFDIPLAKNENGDFRKDNIAFVLKNESDQTKLKIGDSVDLTDKYVAVIESVLTISGIIRCLIECKYGMLHLGTRLISEDGQHWTIIKNDLQFGNNRDKALQQKIKENKWYYYELSFMEENKLKLPEAQSKLSIK